MIKHLIKPQDDRYLFLYGNEEEMKKLTEYLNKIPKMFRKHATEGTCKLIAKEHPDLYKAFEEEASAELEKINSYYNYFLII